MAYRNYILIFVLILLLGFLVLSSKQKLIKKGWLKRTINVVTITAIVFITLAVVFFPDLRSIKTTGGYSYTSYELELTDSSRLEDYKNDGSSRKLSVLVYHPDDDKIKKSTCPLIVFSHGGISTRTSNLSLYKELASHGYVVASISHTYHALSTEIAGKKISIDSGYMKELNSEDSHSDIEKSYEYFQKWMKLRTEDINFVIDSFIQKAAEESGSIYSLVDVTSIGVAGHSLGGSAALGVARQRDDIKAVMALESPYMYDITGVKGSEFTWNTKPFPCPVMNIYSDSGYPLLEADNKYVQNKALYNSEKVESYYIEGSNHYTLTDLVRTSPILCSLLGSGYKKSGYDTLEVINQKSLDFFDNYLKSNYDERGQEE